MEEKLLWGYLCFIEKLTKDVNHLSYKLSCIDEKYEEVLIEISNLLSTCELVIVVKEYKGKGSVQLYQLETMGT